MHLNFLYGSAGKMMTLQNSPGNSLILYCRCFYSSLHFHPQSQSDDGFAGAEICTSPSNKRIRFPANIHKVDTKLD